ncbi:class I SAM-dependent methyltransferase [Isoptericola aurantiacus]|uniref:class I SAM-dependent methyltransferase n=1 Tax=Isoptericola aurantiacus TaxID=3377839 RepID=UPI00383A7497
MPTTPDPASRTDRAASFAQGADVYAHVRPTYPAEAVAWMLPDGATRVLDLGAGTGLLTRRLVEHGCLEVVAVDPSEPMLAHLRDTFPQVEAQVGTAEEIPVPDASVDAVTVGQAWHWFDPARAAAEIARVLRPGGHLGIVWNDRDERIEWVARLGEILHRGDRLEPDGAHSVRAPELGEAFDGAERTEHPWGHRMATSDLRLLAASRSYFLTLPDAEREPLLQQVDDLVVTHPDLAGTTEIALPYVTTAYRARRR